MRHGVSIDGVPGVIFSNGITWIEMRRSSLHILRNFGFGKNVLEDIIDEEVNNLFQYIEDQWIDTSVNVSFSLDVSQFFNVAVLGMSLTQKQALDGHYKHSNEQVLV